MFSSEICMHRSISHRFTWLNGCRSRIIVAMIAESEVYLRYSAPTCTVSPAGKASFLHCSRSSLDLSLKSGREPLTVSSLGSTVFLAFLAASTLLWTWVVTIAVENAQLRTLPPWLAQCAWTSCGVPCQSWKFPLLSSQPCLCARSGHNVGILPPENHLDKLWVVITHFMHHFTFNHLEVCPPWTCWPARRPTRSRHGQWKPCTGVKRGPKS